MKLPLRASLLCFFVITLCTCVRAQNTTMLRGQLQDAEEQPVPFANIALYRDSNLVKVETTDDNGLFRMQEVAPGRYVLIATYLGAPDLVRDVDANGSIVDLGVLRMQPSGVELAEA